MEILIPYIFLLATENFSFENLSSINDKSVALRDAGKPVCESTLGVQTGGSLCTMHTPELSVAASRPQRRDSYSGRKGRERQN